MTSTSNGSHCTQKMGNCLFGGIGEMNEVIKVVTSSGGIMEFYGPITVESITDEFPSHGIFRSHDLFWKPLAHYEVLLAGQSYYLLPLSNTGSTITNSTISANANVIGGQIAQLGHLRSNSVPQAVVAPYRMSIDCHGALKRSYTEVFSRYKNTGFWKVKLVISPEQLLDILSHEGQTQELIESIRTVAKCGNGVSSSVAFSAQWSFSSSRNGSSKKDSLLDFS